MSNINIILSFLYLNISFLYLNTEINNKRSFKENELNKNFIRKSAMDYLNKNFNFITPIFKPYEKNNLVMYFPAFYDFDNCINTDNFKLFEELLNIDYKNKIVSFAYFSKDKIENFKSHPIYKIINNSLEYDYNWLNNSINYYKKNNEIIYKYNQYEYIIIKNLENQLPFKSYCNYPIGDISNAYLRFYNEYDYISSMISFVSVSPQKFM